ncbi:DUF2262 domain-containing protein [Brachyspira innocens]|uniref:DUF2262 domain-containing protein n=1 Tax=Brachyspira innocens TaxID=13264 RepID=UPI0026F28C38|nr:DUF2262 domain-containing protein [Brachyspira innocens]
MSKEIENFNSNFDDEILDLAFVLKESCLGAGKANKDKYYTLYIHAIALKNIASNEIIENDNIIIQKKVKETKEYFQMIKSKSIARLKVRKEKTSSDLYMRFLIEDIICTNYKDNDLNIILEKYLKPIYYKDEELGDFELDKAINCFEKNMSWIDNNISILFEDINEELNKKSADIIKKIFANKKDIDMKLKECAAESIFKPHNTEKEEFIKSISLTSISIDYEDCITFYLKNSDGHTISVNSDWGFNLKPITQLMFF